MEWANSIGCLVAVKTTVDEASDAAAANASLCRSPDEDENGVSVCMYSICMCMSVLSDQLSG